MLTDVRLISDPLSDAESLANRTLDLLRYLQACPSPVQYTVAYVFLSNLNSELSRALHPHVEDGCPIEEKAWRDLYDQYIADCGAAVPEGMSDALQKLLASVAAHISEAQRSTDEFSAEIRQAVAGIDGAPHPLQDVVLDAARRLVRAAEATRARADSLQSQLQSTMADAEQLRGELEEQRRAAMIDPLTGLLNRRGMETKFEALMQAGASTAFSVLMIDIDHFKGINDAFGHAVGDSLIRNVAQVIRGCIRGNDHAVRYGGEEFLVILPETTGEGAATVAEAIRAKVSQLRLVRRRDNLMLPALTVSIGVASLRDGDGDPDSIINRADSALYHSKQEGRNKVTRA